MEFAAAGRGEKVNNHLEEPKGGTVDFVALRRHARQRPTLDVDC